MRLRVGLSTCPNDTFAFHGILERRVDMRGLEVDAELLDVQQLNDGLFADRYDVSKASFHAALLLSDRYDVLGAADVRLDEATLDAIDDLVAPGTVLADADLGWEPPWMAKESRRR